MNSRYRISASDLRDQIVDTSVEVAEEVGWENLRLRKVAQRLGVPLTAVLEYFRDPDAVANAWFTRALREMVRLPEAGFEALSARECVHAVLMRWFDAHAAHRRVVGEMLRTKLYPSHLQHWVPMIFSLSRLIQWVREVALLDVLAHHIVMPEELDLVAGQWRHGNWARQSTSCSRQPGMPWRQSGSSTRHLPASSRSPHDPVRVKELRKPVVRFATEPKVA